MGPGREAGLAASGGRCVVGERSPSGLCEGPLVKPNQVVRPRAGPAGSKSVSSGLDDVPARGFVLRAPQQ